MTQATFASIEKMLLNFFDHYQKRYDAIMSALDDLKAATAANTAATTKIGADLGGYIAAVGNEKDAIAAAVAKQKADDDAALAAITEQLTTNNTQLQAADGVVVTATPGTGSTGAPASQPTS